MKASVLIGPKRSEIREVSISEVGPKDVLVRVEACGVCFSEFPKWHGETKKVQYPLIMGHEPSGVVKHVGNQVGTEKIGQHVTILPTHSGHFTEYFGSSFAEYVVVPADRIVPIPANVSFAEALGEPLACLVSAVERTPIHLAERVAIVGCGFMGLALLQLVKLRGAKEVVGIDIRPDALQQAKDLGADKVLQPQEIDPKDKLTAWEHLGRGYDVVFEVSGTQPGLTLAGELVKAHGTLSIVGYHTDGLRSVDVGLWNWKAFDVINAHERRNDVLMHCMKAGIDLVASGQINMASLVTHTYGLSEVDDAFMAMSEKPDGFIKAVILPHA